MPSTPLRKQLMSKVRSVVVKVGTALLTGDKGLLDQALIRRLVRQLAVLHQRGLQVTLVTSGAVGAGIGRVGLPGRPKSLPLLQATAAIGQPALMSIYEKAFARHKLLVGQVLVTRNDFEQRVRYINISNTIHALHRLNALAIINENDTTAVDELDKFADNDTIGALVTNLLQANLLVVLTVVDGLLNEQGVRVDLVEHVDHVQSLVRNDKSALGSGGMLSKLGAMRLVTDAGEVAVIANGREPDVLLKLLDGRPIGTIFAPAAEKMSAKDRWIRGAVRPAGKITVDAGAAQALCVNGKSLLARGITAVSGKFERGAVVNIVSPEGQTLARGISNYSRLELERIKGLKSQEIAGVLGSKPFDEAIHRDNLVLVAGS